MTDKSLAPEKNDQQTASWHNDALPAAAYPRGGWSLTVMLCLMTGVISGHAIYHYGHLAGVMATASLWPLSWLMLWLALIVLTLLVMVFALRGYSRLA